VLIKKINNSYGVQSEIYGVPNLTANSLIEAASKFYPIKEDLLLR
jgi:hypothetical protein